MTKTSHVPTSSGEEIEERAASERAARRGKKRSGGGRTADVRENDCLDAQHEEAHEAELERGGGKEAHESLDVQLGRGAGRPAGVPGSTSPG